jgi:transposase InsO family protein
MRCRSNDRPTTTASRRAGQAQLTERIKEIAATPVRYGYRRIHVLLCREGWRVNHKRSGACIAS